MAEAQFWMQLVTLFFTLIGGFFGLAKVVAYRFEKLESKLEIAISNVKQEFKADIQRAHARIDQLFLNRGNKNGTDTNTHQGPG